MSGALFLTIVATGFGVAFLHAALPTHWLPFALASRGQGWSHAKTMLITAPPPPRRSDRAAILSLLALLTFSPCESFLPVFLSGARYGWKAFAVLSVTLACATIAGMLVFTSLSMAGLKRLRLRTLERYEGA